jgi:hypothetical protein
MTFDLRVEFSGLCLYLMHPDGDQVGIVMPDARKRTADPRHADGTDGVFHVGYVRFDLANFDADLPPGDIDNGPRYEVVHRFDREALDFDFPDEQSSMSAELEFPDFKEFAPVLRPLPGLFSEDPPKVLLMRTVLRGGHLSGLSEGESWRFSTELNPSAPAYGGQFASFSTWTRRVDGDGLTIRLRRFGDATPTEIPLRPARSENGDAVIALKIANLCAENPLEWPDLPFRGVVGDDVDFKWLYRLLEPPGTTYAKLLRGDQFPVPERRGRQPFGAFQDCMGGRLTHAFV